MNMKVKPQDPRRANATTDTKTKDATAERKTQHHVYRTLARKTQNHTW